MRVSGNNPSESNSSQSNPTPLVASDHLPITRDIEGTKVLSWNIRWSANDDPSVWTNRLPAIVSTVKDANPDVLCFQEVSPDMLHDLQRYLSQYGYQCDPNTFSQKGTLATFYKPANVTPVKSTEQMYRPADHYDNVDRYYLLTEFKNNATNEPLRVANLKGPHLVDKGNAPSDGQVQAVLQTLHQHVSDTLSSWGESNADVNLCGDWNNKITPGAIASTGFVNHSNLNGLGTQVGGAFADAIKGVHDDINKPGVYNKIDDQFLEMNGKNTNVDAQVDTNLFAWGAQPTPPPPTNPVQQYEQALKDWSQQAEGANGYLWSAFINPLIHKIDAYKPPFTSVAYVTQWLNTDPNGKALIVGLLSSKIYSSDPDLANMDPIQAQQELQSLLTTLGVKVSAPLYPMAPIPPGPTPGYIDQLEKAMNAWAGPNPPYGTSGKQALNTYLVSYVEKHNITSAAGLKSAMADFLQTDDKRGIYFKCPGLNDTDLTSAFSVMGLSSAVPPMDNVDKTYSNVVNYCNTHTKDATHYMKPFYAIRDYVANNVNLSEKDLTSFLNGTLRTDPNINFKTFSTVPAYQHQLAWFSSANLPDWK